MNSTFKRIIKMIGIFVLSATVVFLVAFGVLWSKISAIQTTDASNEPVKTEGVYSVLLLGIDTRDKDNLTDARTDTMVLVTVDSKQKRMTLTSFMRDILVDVPNQGMHRLNSAYTFGGADMTVLTIENNFGVEIDRYAVVDFTRAANIIDILGGVDIDVKDYEVAKIKPAISGPGIQHLNGKQATSYMRIRKVGNGDYERTQRQRLVIQTVIKKFTSLSVIDITRLLDEIPKFTQTNASAFDMLNIANIAKNIGGDKVEQMRIPVDGTFDNINYYGASVLGVNFEENARLLKEFLEPPVPSSTTGTTAGSTTGSGTVQ